jgi:hypothetical protein
LGDWRRRGLHALSSGDRDAACHDCGGGHAKPSTRDEIAAGDDRTSMFFGSIWSD